VNCKNRLALSRDIVVTSLVYYLLVDLDFLSVKRFAGSNVSEMMYSVSRGMLNLTANATVIP